ncbi:ATP-binding cassette domain-containing protein [Salisediminibacterium beveridgei]|uniref:Putative multidrug export ATP-binding/permease protein YgaD n=1 Tax=Salisediminibacterium beveridgei TaxID=632773 RepID=A0A1D7QRA4_9BACI|nr:ATP-binding cassette domain-containing protein [Salisediminibacterium beveridgei]AOM81539.1 Putative multidrug export ATP-binding/permease protein YgaD [Salisediminibacterium beveridgei]
MIELIKRILLLFQAQKGKALIIFAILVAELAFQAFLPLSLMLMIDYAIVPGDLRILTLLIVFITVGTVVTSVLGLFRDRAYATLIAGLMADFYQRIFSHLQRLPLHFFKKTKSGDILARYNTDLSALESLLIPFPQLVMASLNLVVNIVILFLLQWQLAGLALFGFALSFVLPNYLSGRAFTASRAHKNLQAAVNASAQENIQGQETIKAFGLQTRMIRGFKQEIRQLQTAAREANFLNYLLDRTTEIGVLFVIVITICAGSLLAFYEMITIGSLSAFVTILVTMSFLISDITWLAPQLVQAKSGLDRIDELLEEEEAVSDGTTTIGPLRQAIRFDHVSFSYDGAKNHLSDANLAIPAKGFNVFVGASGSGKSTMMNLLMRYYEPAEGTIYWDDVAFPSIDDDAFQHEVGIVSQETFLFNRSLRDNIRLGLPEATDEDVEEAAKAAGIHDVITALPDGYETAAGERGGNLSGGQRQRVAIARAILKQPSLLFLDEATSALDPSSEQEILEVIRHLAKDRTVISITHRLTTSLDQDRIFVLDGGQIVETGLHQDLLKKEGHYQTLYAKQSGFHFSDDGQEAFVSGNRLRAIPLLAEVEEALLDDLSNFFMTETFQEGGQVIQEGDEGDKFYLIVRGKADVVKTMDDGTVKTVASLSDGDFFGEIALLKNVPRTASIVAATPLVLLSLQRKMFQSLLKRAPELRAQLEKRL